MTTRYFRFNPRVGGQPQRVPLLEQLLARADESSLREEWRADAYAALGSADPMPAVAAAVYLRACGLKHQEPGDCRWRSLATPLDYVAEMSDVRLASNGILELTEEEAAELAADFAGIWSDSRFRLEAVGALLFCSSTQALQVGQSDPERALGRSIHEFLPTGEDAPALKLLMSEMEMWLFNHAVNEARRARGLQLISVLWPWGGGTPLKSFPATSAGAAGDDVFFSAFVAEKGRRENVMVVQDVPGVGSWDAAPSHWLTSALAELRRGAITRLDLSAGARRFQLTRRWRRRILRKTRPWWEYFD